MKQNYHFQRGLAQYKHATLALSFLGINTTFSGITLINHRGIKILLFNVYLTVGKQKPPSGISPGGFCFPIIFNLPISQIFCQIVVG